MTRSLPGAQGRPPDLGAPDPVAEPGSGGRVSRRIIVLAFVAYFLLVPSSEGVYHQPTAGHIFLLAGIVGWGALTTVVISRHDWAADYVPWLWLGAIVGLAIALFAVGGPNGPWLTLLAIAAAACGRFCSSIRPAIFGSVVCGAAGVVIGALHHVGEGNLAIFLLMPPLAAFLAYTAGKRNETVAKLRQTRAELARIAVAEERLRIARDLHDLLGHSLSLITLKAELARRVLNTDADRASQEIAELEGVARQSLSDVREAVAGYRQPDLAAELAAARQLLTAAGITARIAADAPAGLPPDVDSVLAWTVREGVTNLVRHAGATTATITVASGSRSAVVDISDDGPGRPADPAGAALARPEPPSEPAGTAMNGTTMNGNGSAGTEAGDTALMPGTPRLRRAGSGLAGLAERVRDLGGELAAGHIQPHGFRLRVTIPIPAADRDPREVMAT
jgi:two-component system sensor histidine kinase DesK